jgi:hypothetical protein
MLFTLKKPCAECPFRTDCLKGWLGAPRAKEITTGLLVEEKTFPCHKTTQDRKEIAWEMCAGAAVMAAHLRPNHWRLRFATTLGIRDPSCLVLTSPVFKTAAEMIQHHKH